jgi:hypothetical protein
LLKALLPPGKLDGIYNRHRLGYDDVIASPYNEPSGFAASGLFEKWMDDGQGIIIEPKKPIHYGLTMR